MPLVPTTDSRMIAAILLPPSNVIVSRRCCSARSHLLLGRLRVERRAVGVRPPELHETGDRRFVVEPTTLAGQSDRRGRAAVVAAVGRQHLQPAGVALRHADRVLDRLGAGVGEEHLLEVARRRRPPVGLLDDQTARLAALVVGEARRDHAQHVGLVLDRLDHLRMLMAEIHVHELAGEVDPLSCRARPRTSSRARRRSPSGRARLGRPRMEHVGPIVGVRVARQRSRVRGSRRGHDARVWHIRDHRLPFGHGDFAGRSSTFRATAPMRRATWRSPMAAPAPASSWCRSGGGSTRASRRWPTGWPRRASSRCAPTSTTANSPSTPRWTRRASCSSTLPPDRAGRDMSGAVDFLADHEATTGDVARRRRVLHGRHAELRARRGAARPDQGDRAVLRLPAGRRAARLLGDHRR